MYHIFFHSSVNGHLGCFNVLVIVNNATVNIGVHISFRIGVFNNPSWWFCIFSFENQWHRGVKNMVNFEDVTKSVSGCWVKFNQWSKFWGAKCLRILAFDPLRHSNLKDDRTLSDLNPASCNIMDKPGEHYVSEISETQKNNPLHLQGGNLKKSNSLNNNKNNTVTESNGCFQVLRGGKKGCQSVGTHTELEDKQAPEWTWTAQRL